MSSEQQASSISTVADLVTELKAHHRVRMANFRAVVNSLAASNTAEANLHGFLLREIGQHIYFRADLELTQATDILLGGFNGSSSAPSSQNPLSQDPPSQDPPSQDPPSQDPPSQEPSPNLADLTQYMTAMVMEEVQNNREERPDSDPYEIDCPDVAEILLIRAGIITKQEIDWWFHLLYKANHVVDLVILSEEQEANISAEIDGMAADLNRLRDIIKTSYVDTF